MRRFLLLLLSLTLAIAPACAAEAISFTDSLGETVELSKRPENVAVLFSSFAEMWTLAGGEVAGTGGESIERGFQNLKGYRSVGGIRASIYNAMPVEGVEALVDFMAKFERENG